MTSHDTVSGTHRVQVGLVVAEVDLGIPGLSDAEPVGAGGNAVVYRPREVDHDRWVAVKISG
jgi:hypothetical protein